MTWLNHTIRRIENVLELASALLTADYPYPQARRALNEIHAQLKKRLSTIRRISANPNASVQLKRVACIEALEKIHVFFPALGFLYRSGNLANPFEAVLPLQRMAKKLIGESSELALSSEWHYSPFTYLQIPGLSDLVLIGFPASEASNALLLPLAGHELGHSVWRVRALQDRYDVPTTVKTVEVILGRREEAEKYLGSIDPATLPKQTDRLAQPQTWALWQCQEIFCDFVGVRIFGRAYLEAFGYLISPGLPGYRSPRYPTTTRRVSYLEVAAERFSVTVPQDYADQFRDSAPLPDKETSFWATVADEVATHFVDDLLNEAGKLVTSAGIALPTEEQTKHVAEALRHLVPAEEPKSVAAIVNAAWVLTADEDLWNDQPELQEHRTEILNELTLKTLEVFDIGERVAEHRAASVPAESTS